jgi:hypothetical protein
MIQFLCKVKLIKNKSMMRTAVFILPVLLFAVSCSDAIKAPDVSGIEVKLIVKRFEKDFFAADTNKINQEIDRLNQLYPEFMPSFMVRILNADPKWPNDTVATYVRNFITPFTRVNDSAQRIFNNFTPYENEIKQSIRYLKYYFPEYKVPEKVITYVGPLDGYGDIIAPDAFIVGLHHHLGKNSAFYQAEAVQQIYPSYITEHFEPTAIAVNCMKNVVDDILTENNDDKPLVQQMVQRGKRLYILSRLLPKTDEYKLIGYTAIQIKDCYTNEARIWDLFVQNDYLQVADKSIIKNFIGESPKTQELGEASPGDIGSFAGWQIVKEYMAKNPKTTLQQLIAMDANTIFQQAKYKP